MQAGRWEVDMERGNGKWTHMDYDACEWLHSDRERGVYVVQAVFLDGCGQPLTARKQRQL